MTAAATRGEEPGVPWVARTLNGWMGSNSGPRSVPRVHRWLYRHSGGRLGHGIIGLPALLLHTTGRRTGLRRTAALVYARDGDSFVVAASNYGGAHDPAWVGNIPDRHDLYWKTEAAMADGNPMLMLEQGEKVQTPPALWLQGRPDPVHDYHDPDSGFTGTEPERFTANYRKAGGNIELLIVEQAERTTAATLGKVADFFHQHIPVNR